MTVYLLVYNILDICVITSVSCKSKYNKHKFSGDQVSPHLFCLVSDSAIVLPFILCSSRFMEELAMYSLLTCDRFLTITLSSFYFPRGIRVSVTFIPHVKLP